MNSWMTLLLITIPLVHSRQGSCGECSCIWGPRFQYMDCRNLHMTSLPYPLKFRPNMSTSIFVVDSIIPNLPGDFFLNFTGLNVTYVSLRNNSIQNMSEMIFKSIPNLEGLDLSWNNIDIMQTERAFRGIQNANFRKLNISHMNIRNIPDNLFKPFEISRAINISIHHNNLTMINQKAIMNVPGIAFFDVSTNRISNLSFESNFSSSLKILKMDNNKLNSFPNFCRNSSDSYLPELRILRIQWNFMRDINTSSFNCLRKLQRLHLTGNIFNRLENNMFSSLASIERITLSESFALQHINGDPFNNTHLKRVFFRKNFLYTENPHHSLKLFEGCTSMELLNVADNVLDKTPDSEFDNMLRPLINLQILIMGGCRLTRIPPAVVKYLVNLRELVLYNNRIVTWPDGTLDSLKKLEIIYMRQNEITTVSEASFPPRFMERAKHVDLSQNPFQCSCDLRWFIAWMKSHPRVFQLNSFINHYKCESPANYRNVLLKDLPLSDNICLLDLNSKIITLAGSTILILFLVVGSVLYYYRWHIRYLIFMLRYKNRPDVDHGHYEYDAFVAYSNEDRPWVLKTLMPVLEDHASLKLCIHDRDFEVGKLIVDNIVDCIESSRCLIIVLSNSFAQSDWCQFELSLIQRHVIENGHNHLVLVMLEEIDTRHVTKSIRAMLQTTTYLLWGEAEYARKAFFNRLRLLLRKPSGTSQKRRLSV